MLKRSEVIGVWETYSRKLLLTLTPFLRFLEGTLVRKSIIQSERSDGFQPGKILKIIEHVGYSVRYCKILLLIYSESGGLSNVGCSFTHPLHAFCDETTDLENQLQLQIIMCVCISIDSAK